MARTVRCGLAVDGSLEFVVIQTLGDNPVHTGHACHADDGAEGGLGDGKHT